MKVSLDYCLLITNLHAIQIKFNKFTRVDDLSIYEKKACEKRLIALGQAQGI